MKSEGICCGVPKLTNNLEVPIAWRCVIHLNALLLPSSVRKPGSEDHQLWVKFSCRQQKYEFVWALVGISALVDGL